MVLTCGGGAASAVQADKVSYHGYSVVRAAITSPRDLRFFASVDADMWSHGVREGKADYMLNAQQMLALRTAGIPFEVLIGDVGPLVDAESARLSQQPGDGLAGGDFFTDFRTIDQINARLDELAALHPTRASVVVVGQSLEGRTIRGLRISAIAEPAPLGTPALVFDACQHAREWATPPVAMFIAERLLEDEATSPLVASIVSQSEVFIVPVVNPDGYAFTWAGTRLWRKNRRDNLDGTFGVDLNRNWGYQWGGPGSSAATNSETYRGTSAFSEPESAALRDFVAARSGVVANIDFHSYSQLILSAWGWTTALAPDATLLQSMGASMREAVLSTHGTPYTAGPIGSTLYLASGGSVDWMYGDQGILSWTIEVRDTGAYGFIMPAADIVPNAQENYAAALKLMQAVSDGVVLSLIQPIPAYAPTGSPISVSVDVRWLLGGTSSTVRCKWRVGAAVWNTLNMSNTGGNTFAASIPAAPCGAQLAFYFEVLSASSGTVVESLPVAGASSPFEVAVTSSTLVVAHDLETDTGWQAGVAGDSATAGVWIRVDPNGTTAQSEDDHTSAGTQCFVTGQGAVGAGAGSADLDGGITTLVSPVFDASAPGTSVSFFRWYSNNLGGSPGQDSMPIEVSGDNGVTWVTLETVSQSATAWVGAAFALDGLIAPSAAARVRFVARDLGAGSLVEAGIDDLEVTVTGCPGNSPDIDGDGVVSGSDLAILLAMWGAAGAADLDGNTVVDGVDLAMLLANWG